jgi:hypothetical protein
MQVARFQRVVLRVGMTVVFCVLAALTARAQQTVASMPVSDAKVTGAVEISGNEVRLASGAGIAAGVRGADLSLARGGDLNVCSNSAVHLASGANPGEMMLSLDSGGLELHGKLGEFSDVIMTPDLRVLLSGPATADVKVRVNQQGDTCIDNAGDNAPYVTVTEQLGTGVYRVQSGQRVMLEHGSVTTVVDHEKEPCGCPAVAPAEASPLLAASAKNAQDFPLAQSEGLAPAPPAPTQPVVPPGEVHAEVTVPFVFNGHTPADLPPANAPPAVVPSPTVPLPPAKPDSGGDVWSAVKHLFGRIFGKKQ